MGKIRCRRYRGAFSSVLMAALKLCDIAELNPFGKVWPASYRSHHRRDQLADLSFWSSYDWQN
jgi:hypothetical protein